MKYYAAPSGTPKPAPMRYRSELGRYLNSLELVGVGAEVGVHTGRFAEQILRTWKGRTLWLIDAWRNLEDYRDSWNASDAAMERRYMLARRRLAPWGERTKWLRERSNRAAKDFAHGTLDFVYIDANHSFEHVSQDLRAWYPLVRTGGLIAGHDYFDAVADAGLEPVFGRSAPPEQLTSYGVKSAVDAFTGRLGVPLSFTKEKFPTWYFVKL